MCNMLQPGLGTQFSAYYNKAGVSWKTFGMGMLQSFLWVLFLNGAYLTAWTILGFFVCCFIAFLVYVWNIYHSYLIWRVSRETFYN